MEGYKTTGEKVFVKKYKTPDNLFDPDNAEYISINENTGEKEFVFYKTLERALLPRWTHNETRNGEILSYHPNGQIDVKQIKSNNKNTFFATYYDNGKIKTICEHWLFGYTYGDSYEYYPDGKKKRICLRPNGNFGGIKEYFPNGKLKSCQMGNYYIEFFENNNFKWFIETDPKNDYYTICNVMWDEIGNIKFGIFGIGNNEFLEIDYEKDKLIQKFIKNRYEDEPKIYFVKDGKKVEHSLFENIYYFNKINSYENYLPKINIPNIDWNNYIVDTGIRCAEI